jgi:acyl-CoA thioester hydrolase
MGVIYHANYIPWFELSRNEYCRAVGYPYTELSATENIHLMVTEIGIKYHAPTFFDDEVLVRTWVEAAGRATCLFGYQIWNETTAKLSVEGWTEHAAVSKDTGRPQRFSPRLYDLLQANLGTGPSKYVHNRLKKGELPT